METIIQNRSVLIREHLLKMPQCRRVGFQNSMIETPLITPVVYTQCLKTRPDQHRLWLRRRDGGFACRLPFASVAFGLGKGN